MTRVLIDRQAGFCAGVRRALRGARRVNARYGSTARSARIASYGELIHNPQVTGALAQEGIRVVDELESLRPGDRVIIRTHGIPPQEERLLQERGIAVHDFTCPRVKEVHRAIQTHRGEGRRILIVGVPDHPEVKGHLGYAGEGGAVLSSVEDAGRCALAGRMLVVAQTTISPGLFQSVVRLLEERLQASPPPDPPGAAAARLHALDTTCPFVRARQEWIRQASRLAGATLVIGGRRSSNTHRLVEIAAVHGPVYWIEHPQELDEEELLKHPAVAVTAGASTPDEAVRKVVDRLVARGAQAEELP